MGGSFLPREELERKQKAKRMIVHDTHPGLRSSGCYIEPGFVIGRKAKRKPVRFAGDSAAPADAALMARDDITDDRIRRACGRG